MRSLQQKMPESRRQRGITLVEMIVAITLTGLLVAAVTSFIARPVEGYIDAAAHAQLVAAADTAMRRISRDLHAALPNSVHLSAGSDLVEYLDVRTGGRYRADPTLPAPGVCPNNDASIPEWTVLSFGRADTCFQAMTDAASDPELANINPATDYVVVFNLGPGVANADAYQTGTGTGNNSSIVSAAASGTEYKFTITPNTFTYQSPGNRFNVISGPVAYKCDLATKTLTRYSGYAIQSTSPANPNLAAASSALIAKDVLSCSFSYAANIANLNAGVVTVNLALSDARGGLVTLQQQVHVNNVP